MRFYHRLIRTLKLPGNAAIGAPQIIIGPDLPIPLQSRYAAAILLQPGISTGLQYNEYLGIVKTIAPLAYSKVESGWYWVNAANTQGWFYASHSYWVDNTLTVPSLMLENIGVLGISGTVGGAVLPTFDFRFQVNGLTILTQGLQVSGAAALFNNGATIPAGAPWSVDNVSQPRGVLPGGYVSSTGAAGPVGAAFTPVLSLGAAISFVGGRVYAVHVGGGGLSTSLTTNVMEVRVNWFPGGVGTPMFDAASFGPELGASRQHVYNVNYFGFTSNATSTDIIVYAKASAGTITWYGDYSGQNRNPRFLMIEDKGALASFPGVTMLN